MDIIRRHIIVHGRVQGVGYRYFTQKCAEDLGLYGWVRNCRDGTVELEVQGNVGVVEAFKQKLKRGPFLSRVDRLQLQDVEPEKGTRSFLIRY